MDERENLYLFLIIFLWDCLAWTILFPLNSVSELYIIYTYQEHKKTMKILLYVILFLALVVSIFILPKALRVHKVKTLYDKDKIVYNFTNMDKIFPSRNIKASENPEPIKRNIQALPETFSFIHDLFCWKSINHSCCSMC